MRAQLLRGEVNTYCWRVRFERGTPGSPYQSSCDAENAGLVACEDTARRTRRFQILSFGANGDDPRAIVDMELIWMVALLRDRIDARVFIRSLCGELPWGSRFEEAALEAGVDYQVRAYLAGALVEHILSDVDFEPETRVLDYPWPNEVRRPNLV